MTSTAVEFNYNVRKWWNNHGETYGYHAFLVFCLESGWLYLAKVVMHVEVSRGFKLHMQICLYFKTQLWSECFMFCFERYTWRSIILAIQFYPGYIFCVFCRTACKDNHFDNYFWLTSRSYFSFTIATDHMTRLKFCAKNKDIFHNSQDSLHTKIHRHNHPTFQISNLSLAHFFGLKWTFYSSKCKISSAQVWNHCCS